ncbi:MAG: hypothetical protein ACREH3_02060 [Geminicoccales bacterium]
MRSLLAAAVLVAGLTPPAAVADLAAAQALYEQGAMHRAAQTARHLQTANGFALAAKATLADAIYLTPKAAEPALLERAADDARRALQLDPNHVGAMLELAVALGHLAEEEGPITAHLNGYAEDGKKLLDKALALDPDNPWAHGLLGIWHLQVVRYASDELASKLYGASRKRGLEQCARAEALAPTDLVLSYGCAISMLELDKERYGAEAARLLNAVVRMPAQDAAERLVQREARRAIGDLEPG